MLMFLIIIMVEMVTIINFFYSMINKIIIMILKLKILLENN